MRPGNVSPDAEASSQFSCFGSSCAVYVGGNGDLVSPELAVQLERRRLLAWHSSGRNTPLTGRRRGPDGRIGKGKRERSPLTGDSFPFPVSRFVPRPAVSRVAGPSSCQRLWAEPSRSSTPCRGGDQSPNNRGRAAPPNASEPAARRRSSRLLRGRRPARRGGRGRDGRWEGGGSRRGRSPSRSERHGAEAVPEDVTQ